MAQTRKKKERAVGVLGGKLQRNLHPWCSAREKQNITIE